MTTRYKIAVTFNKVPWEQANLPPLVAQNRHKIEEAIAKLPEEYQMLMAALKIPVEITDTLPKDTSGVGGLSGPRLNSNILEQERNVFAALREEVVHTLDARLGRFTSRPEWIEAVRMDSDELRAKVVMQLQRFIDQSYKRLAGSEYYAASRAEEMLPEIVAVEAMFKQGNLWDAIVACEETRGVDKDIEAIAREHGFENNDVKKARFKELWIKEGLCDWVALFVLGVADKAQDIFETTVDKNEAKQKVRALQDAAREEHAKQIKEIGSIIDYYIDNPQGKKPEELMAEAFPHLYPQYLGFKERIEGKLERVRGKIER